MHRRIFTIFKPIQKDRRRRRKKKKKPQGKNIMACPTTYRAAIINTIKSRLAIKCLYLGKNEVSARRNGNLQPEREIN